MRVHHQENEVNIYNNTATKIISTRNTNRGADLDEGDKQKNFENYIDDNAYEVYFKKVIINKDQFPNSHPRTLIKIIIKI